MFIAILILTILSLLVVADNIFGSYWGALIILFSFPAGMVLVCVSGHTYLHTPKKVMKARRRLYEGGHIKEGGWLWEYMQIEEKKKREKEMKRGRKRK